jgi:hypothetical protein
MNFSDQHGGGSAMSGLDTMSVSELQVIVQQHPYFSAAHLLLAKKLKEENGDGYAEQLMRTTLYFDNTLWLAGVLERREIQQDLLKTSETSGVVHAVHENIADDSHEQNAVEQSTVLEAPFTDEGVVAQTITSTGIEQHVESISGGQVDVQEEEKVPFGLAEVDLSHTRSEFPGDDKNEDGNDIKDGDRNNIETEDGNDIKIKDRTDILNQDDIDGSSAEGEKIDDDPSEPALEIKIPGFKEEIRATPDESQLTFEPYHTVDYFASQGIKFKDDGRPKDRFSEQLRSFTEWLKTMKRVTAADVAAGIPVTEEKKVEQMAEQSIADRQVVTEAMAEVWEKQGDTLKAKQIYQKLSLLDPAKSSYFAAKIEHLKNL